MERDVRTTEGDAWTGWRARHLWSLLGFVLLLWWFPFYAYVSIIAPEWMVLPALAVWVTFLVLVLRWFKPHPVRAFLVGLGAIVLWNLVALFGDLVLGWTA